MDGRATGEEPANFPEEETSIHANAADPATEPQCRRLDSEGNMSYCAAAVIRSAGTKDASPPPPPPPPPMRRIDSFTCTSSRSSDEQLDACSDDEASASASASSDDDEPPQVLSVNMFSMYATGECALPIEGVRSEEEEAADSRGPSQQTAESALEEDAVRVLERNKTLSSNELCIPKKLISSDDGEAAVDPSPTTTTLPKRSHIRVRTLPGNLEMSAAIPTGSHASTSAERPSAPIPRDDIRRATGFEPIIGASSTSAKPSPLMPKPSHRRNKTLPTALRLSPNTGNVGMGIPARPEERPYRRLTPHTPLGEMMKMCGVGGGGSETCAPPRSGGPAHRRVQTLPTSVIAEMVGTKSITGRSDNPPRQTRFGLPPRPPEALFHRKQSSRAPPAPLSQSGHAASHERVVPDWAANNANIGTSLGRKEAPPTHRRSSSAPLLAASHNGKKTPFSSSPFIDPGKNIDTGKLPREDEPCRRRRQPNVGGNALGDLSQLCNVPITDDDTTTPDPKLLAGRRRHDRTHSRDSSGGSLAGNSAVPPVPAGSDKDSSPEQYWDVYYEKQKLKNIVKGKYRLGRVVPKPFSKKVELKRANSAKLV